MKDYQAQLETLQQWIDESKNIVFFGGAGVSTESGIPDFRSVDGLYNQQYKYPPETIGTPAKGQQKTDFAHQRGRACGKSAGPSFCARQKRAKTAG